MPPVQLDSQKASYLDLKLPKRSCTFILCPCFLRGLRVVQLPEELQLNIVCMTSLSVSCMRPRHCDFLEKLIQEKYICFPEELVCFFLSNNKNCIIVHISLVLPWLPESLEPNLMFATMSVYMGCVFILFYHPCFFSFFFFFLH